MGLGVSIRACVGLLSLATLRGVLAQFVSEPTFELPQLSVTYRDNATQPANGYIFLSPRVSGPRHLYIYDQDLNLVYYNDTSDALDASYFKPHRWGDDYVYAFHSGDMSKGFSNGTAYIVNQDYTLNSTLSTEHNVDGHEFRITPDGYASMTSYVDVGSVDIGSAGNANTNDGWIVDSCIQEVNLANHSDIRIRFCPRHNISLDMAYNDVAAPPTARNTSWDWFHANAVNRDALGNFLISSRHTHALYYVDGQSRDILWTVGGKNSSFSGNGTQFSWQHYVRFVKETGVDADDIRARMHGGKRWISVYDNASSGFEKESDHSRGLVIELDFASMTATILQVFENPGGTTGLLSDSQGSIQLLSDEPNSQSDHVIMGFGQVPVWAEYTSDGKAIQVVWFGERDKTQAFQVVKMHWAGYPLTKPSIAVKNKKLYVSWNGATDVDHWVVESSIDEQVTHNETKTTKLPKTGFETSYDLEDMYSRYRVFAMNKDDCTLATSDYIKSNNQNQGGGTPGKNYAQVGMSDICPSPSNETESAMPSARPILFNGAPG